MLEQKESKSKGNTKNESENSIENGTQSRPLREIIYLDLNKITSYLSQIQNGLTEYLERIKIAGAGETSHSSGIGFGGGAVPFRADFKTGNQASIDATALIQRKQHHHAALSVLEDLLSEKHLIGTLDSNRPFVKHTGHPLLIDFKLLYNRFSRITEVRKALDHISNLDESRAESLAGLSKTQRKELDRSRAEALKKDDLTYKSFTTLFEEYGDRLDILFTEDNLTGVLNRGDLVLPPEHFQAVYGSPARIPLTLIGLNTTGGTEQEEVTIGAPQGDEGMMYAFGFLMNEYNRLVGKQLFVSQSATSIVPIALFIDV